MRVIFHIGQQKTGSTAIQEALRRDRPRLLDRGILFPDTGHDPGLRDAKHANHNGLFLALHRGKSLSQTLDEIRTELSDQIAENEPDTVLISAEAGFMAADLRKRTPLDTLDEILPGDKEIVVYLRRPDRYVASMHQQMIRNGNSIAALHTSERLDHLESTCQLDYARALAEYGDRYGPVTAFRYEDSGDAVDHFYREVLGLDPPEDRPQRPNTSIPTVLVDLAREYTNTHGRMGWHQAQALVRFGRRETVDLLGPDNRRRVAELFAAQNAALGALVGREAFFDDLDHVTQVPDGSITPDEANERYRAIFETLVALPTVFEVRRSCLDLESRGRYWAAGQLFASQSKHLEPDEIDWYREDLEAATGGEYTIVDGRYGEVNPVPPAVPAAPPVSEEAADKTVGVPQRGTSVIRSIARTVRSAASRMARRNR